MEAETLITELIAQARSLLNGIFRAGHVDADLREEFRLHMELRAADLVRSGVTPADAARMARAEFGDTEDQLERARRARGLAWFDELRFSWLDLKLGWRSLVKYPALNLVAGAAIAFAVACAALVFEGVKQVLHPHLPLPHGNRVVGIRVWNMARSRNEEHLLYYYARWRNDLRTIAELGAFTDGVTNVADNAGSGAGPARFAAITVSGFRVARAAPLLGRSFVEADEQLGAPPVVIVGHGVWQRRFGADSNLIGRAIRVGEQLRTVVGVMPREFAYPTQHELWIPLPVGATGQLPGRGPPVRIVGRLAPGATLSDAQKELTVLAARASSDVPAEFETVRAQVMPYAKSIVFVPADAGLGFRSVNLITVLLLILACGNVALLVFARATTRDTELIVRQALGASRARIITQLFAESLVLAMLAATAGLAVAGYGMKWVYGFVKSFVMLPPFWFHDSLSPTTFGYALVLAVIAAAITGALPAARMTRDLGLQVRASASGAGGVRMGRTLSLLMAAQVTAAVLFPVSTYTFRQDLQGYQSIHLGYPAEEYVAAQPGIDPAAGVASAAGRVDSITAASFVRNLRNRVTALPAVTAVTFASALPGMLHQHVRFEIDAAGTLLPDSLHRGGTAVAAVDVNYFEAMQARVRLGRGFKASDLRSSPRPVVVTESFVTFRTHGRNPIGWRLRYSNPADPEVPRKSGQEPGPWMEIVGVVNDLAMTNGGDPRPFPNAGFYLPMEPRLGSPLYMAVRVQGRRDAVVQQIYAEATSIDPRVRLAGIFPAADINKGELLLPRTLFRASILLSVMALLISGAALYAVTSVIVRRRTQEIGIRVALGSGSRRVLALILRRPFLHVGSGVLVGTALTLLFGIASVVTVLGYGALMLAVCMAGCVAPAMRALRIAPMEALRTE